MFVLREVCPKDLQQAEELITRYHRLVNVYKTLKEQENPPQPSQVWKQKLQTSYDNINRELVKLQDEMERTEMRLSLSTCLGDDFEFVHIKRELHTVLNHEVALWKNEGKALQFI